MKKRGISILAAACLLMFCVGFFARSGFVYANSAQRYWEGSPSAGVSVSDADCPLEVEHEKLTFDIPHFPEHFGDDEEKLKNYGAKVTAEYSFYNPAAYDVTATLAFPFGDRPDYIYPELFKKAADRYDITVNGEAVEKRVRHTNTRYYGDFDIDKELPKIRDGYASDRFFATDLRVTEYVYEFEKIERKEDYAPYAAFEINCAENTRVMVSNANGFDRDGERVRVGLFVRDYDRVSVYAIGEEFSSEQSPNWTFYSDGGMEKTIEGRALLMGTKVTSFLDFATRDYTEESGVSKVDWYNAVVDNLNEHNTYGGKYLGITEKFSERDLMRWYEYDITVGSGERLINTVTAPLYPMIDDGFEPSVHVYDYLASPAKTWKKFGSLDIEIKTPFYMTDNGDLAWEKTDGGYKLNLSGLPENEINFSLCAEEKPKRVKNVGFVMIIAFIVLIVAGGLIALGAAVFAVVMVVRAYKKAHPKTPTDGAEVKPDGDGKADGTEENDGNGDENTIE